MSEITRMAGLVSGLDIEALVKAGTQNTKNAINTRKQKLQTLQWKQESYRSVITAISDFQSKYLNILSPTSIRANSVMKSNKATSSNESLSVSATTSAVASKYSITSVKGAKTAAIEGKKASSGSVALNFARASEGNNTVKVTLDGTTRNVTFKGGANAKDNFLTALNESFDGVTAAQFSFMDGTNKLTIKNAADDKVSHIFTVGYNSAVGLENDASNTISTKSTIGSLDFATGLQGSNFSFSINGKDFSFNKDTTVKDMMNTINKADIGVKMTFSSLTQAFTLETTETGAGQEIEISQKSGNLVNALFNIGNDQLGVAPTESAVLVDKTVDAAAEFKFSVSNTGLANGDDFIINNKVLSVTGLTQKQKTEKITVDGSEVNARLYKDADGNDIYRYSADGATYYAKKNGTAYDTVMSVEADGSINVNGSDVEGATEEEQLKALGIEKNYETYSAYEYQTALNDAYKASFPEGKGSFAASTAADGSIELIFTPGQGEAVAAAAAGNVSLADTGHGADGIYTNYEAAPYAADKAVAGKGELSMVVNGTDIVKITGTGADGGITIKDLTDSGYFTYDSATGELSVAGKNRIDIAPESGMDNLVAMKDMFGSLNLVGKDNTGSMKVYGSNAQITVNGVTLESASNSFSIDGTIFGIENVKDFDEADIAAGDAEEITVDVAKDTSKIKETIKGFVDAYNELLTTINKTLTTSRPKSSGSFYDPLTEEQEEEMEQDEIDKWNEKAKEGLLYHDATLTKVFNNIRQAISTASGGMTLQALGIDTSSDYTEFGKLEIKDESALDSAIERYGEEIADFFTNAETGLGTVLNNAVNAAIDTKTDRRGYAKGILTSVAGMENTRSDKKNLIFTQIESIQSIIENLNTKYESQQERLWKSYSTLETYINNMNSQSASLFGTTTTQTQ